MILITTFERHALEIPSENFFAPLALARPIKQDTMPARAPRALSKV